MIAGRAAGVWALALFARAAGAEPSSADYERRMSDAALAAAAGALDEAAGILSAAAPSYPEDYALHAAWGAFALGAGQYSVARDALREALALNASAAAVHSQLALALFWLDDLEGAEAEYRRALELDPEDAEARSGLGWVSLRRGRSSDARAWFRAALSRAPGLASAELGLSQVPPALRLSIFAFAGGMLAPSAQAQADAWLLLGGVDLQLWDHLFASTRYRRAESLGKQVAGRGFFLENEVELALGWGSARYGVSLNGGFVSLAQGVIQEPELEDTHLFVAGAGARVSLWAELGGALTATFGYDEGAVLQAQLTATKVVWRHLSIELAGRAELTSDIVYPALLLEVAWSSGPWQVRAGAELGRQLRPFDLATLAVYPSGVARVAAAHAALGVPLGGPFALEGWYELEVPEAEGSSPRNLIHRLLGGIMLSL